MEREQKKIDIARPAYPCFVNCFALAPIGGGRNADDGALCIETIAAERAVRA